MVAQSDLDKVAALTMEWGTISQVLAMIDAGDARIIDMTWGRGVARVTVSTRDMTYPQAMVDSIKQFLTARANAIKNELGTLGVTDIEPPRGPPSPDIPPPGQPARQAAAPAAAPHAAAHTTPRAAKPEPPKRGARR